MRNTVELPRFERRGLTAFVVELVSLTIAQLGLRIDRMRSSWIVALVVATGLGIGVMAVASTTLTITYFVATWAYYYIGNSLILGTGWNHVAIRRLGAETAFRRYEVLVGTMFVSQGLGVTAMCALIDAPIVLIPHAVALPLGAVMLAIGFGIKTWAIHLVGLDTYYFKDLFVGEFQGSLVTSGPYRWLANPMYGVGQLHAYGLALMSNSMSGLLAAAFCQLSIYGFYFAVERPFLARMSSADRTSPESS